MSHGKGKLILHGEGQYDGEFVEGKKHGKGVWTGPDDILYDGQYQNDRRHGESSAERRREKQVCALMCMDAHTKTRIVQKRTLPGARASVRACERASEGL